MSEQGLSMRAVCEQGIGWTAKALLVYLCQRSNAERISWAKADTITSELGMSRPTYFRAKAELIDQGLIAERPDLRDRAVEVYPDDVGKESQSDTGSTKNETMRLAGETASTKNETPAQSQIDTATVQNLRLDSLTGETHIIGMNYSRTIQELSSEVSAKPAKTEDRTNPREDWKPLPGKPPLVQALHELFRRAPGLKPKRSYRSSPTGNMLNTGLPGMLESKLVHGWREVSTANPPATWGDFLLIGDWYLAGGLDWNQTPLEYIIGDLPKALTASANWRDELARAKAALPASPVVAERVYAHPTHAPPELTESIRRLREFKAEERARAAAKNPTE